MICIYIYRFHQWGETQNRWLISWKMPIKWMIGGDTYCRFEPNVAIPIPCCGYPQFSRNLTCHPIFARYPEISHVIFVQSCYVKSDEMKPLRVQSQQCKPGAPAMSAYSLLNMLGFPRLQP